MEEAEALIRLRLAPADARYARGLAAGLKAMEIFADLETELALREGDDRGRPHAATRRALSVPATLVDWIGAVARAQAGRPAVYGEGVTWSYRELWERAGGIAGHLLSDRGLRPGDRVGIVGANEPAYLAAYFGVLRAGGVAVPLNAMLDVADMRAQL